MKSKKIDSRVVDWARCPKGWGECDVTGCQEVAHETEVGDYCLPHYRSLPSCIEDECARPRAQRTNKCREHFINECPEVVAAQRYDIMSSKSSLCDCSDHAPGGMGSLGRSRKKTRKKTNKKRAGA